MAMQWPVSKLDTINSALSLTGNNLVTALEDGSDEYNVCSPAYEAGLAIMMEDHGWGFATVVNPNLPAAANAPANPEWDTAYNLPQDLLHLIWVKINNDTNEPSGAGLPSATLYDIEGGQLVLNAQGGPPPPSPPQAPSIVSIKYVSTTFADVTNGTPLFVQAIRSFVMSGIYRGLHEDTGEADKLWQAGEMYSQRARSRYDQQKPKRSMWNSRITAARRIRRPWPPSPGGWGGSGIPG